MNPRRLALLAVVVVLPFAGVVRAAEPAKTAATGTRALFDGKTLTGWAQSGFENEGAVKVESPFRSGAGALIIEAGQTLSGVTWIKGAELPRSNYEISLEAMKLKGNDFFCGLTFPVGSSACSFIVGGWSGNVTGISSINDADASENETARGKEYADNRWYRIRVRVTDEKLEAWIDDEQMAEVELQGKKISLRPGDIQKSLPLGVATYMTRAAIRNIQLRKL